WFCPVLDGDCEAGRNVVVGSCSSEGDCFAVEGCRGYEAGCEVYASSRVLVGCFSMYSTRGVDFHFYAEASLVLLCVYEDVASSRDQARLSKRAVARQRSRAQDVVEGPCGVSVRQDGTGVGDREGECCDAVKSVALNRASEIAQWDGYRNRAGRRV